MDCEPLKKFVPENAAAKFFKKEIDSIPAEYAGGIEDAAYRETLTLLRDFRAGGTARIVAEHLTARV